MKSQPIKFSIALALLLLIGETACKKEFLDTPPLDAISSANFYSSVQQVNQGTAPLYNVPWFDLNDKALWAIGDISSGNLNTGDPAVVNFRNFLLTGDNIRLIESWRSLFNAVAQANFIINNLPVSVAPSVDKSVVNRALGEARFMRALSYFYLVRLWGAVPIIENNLDVLTNSQVSRNRVEDIYTLILNDLAFAEANCPLKSRYSGTDAARVSQGAAKALLAKVYLYQKDYAKARVKAEEVINSGEYELMADYADIFKLKNNVNASGSANKETIFAFIWQTDNAGWGVQNTNQGYFAPYGEGITGANDGYGSAFPTIDILNTYESGDKRLAATFMVPGFYYPELKQANGGYTYPASPQLSPTYGSIKKYVIGTDADNGGKGLVAALKTPINTNVLRYADVYLIAAEAIMAGTSTTSDAKALTYVNKVRSRAGLLPKTTLTFDDLLRERRLELAVEADYWFDLGRIDRAKAITLISQQERGFYDGNKKVYSDKKTPRTEDFIFPIPNSELSKNPKLKEEPVAYTFK